MRLRLLRRLERLEKWRAGGPIILRMPDGRMEELPRSVSVADLLEGACRGDKTRLMKMLSESVDAIEPGDGRLVELARAILNSPE